MELRPSAQANFIYGPNGSGKTSLLECLSTLAMGRSFRTRKFKNLIANDQPELQLFCEFTQEEVTHRLGVIRGRDGNSLFKLDDSGVSSASELAAILPCQVIDSHSFDLLEGGPGERRTFLDWLVFHVKPEFRRVWHEFSRCLKHRNSLLRSGRMQPADLHVWNSVLVTSGETIDSLRRDILGALTRWVNEYAGQCEFGSSGQVEMRYQPGWNPEVDFGDQLEASLERDLAMGHTTLGPHKSDIRVAFNGRPVVDVFSRGQLKILIFALYIAQLRAFQTMNSNGCLLLVDDLPAEFDSENLARVCRWLKELPDTQIFVTGIDLDKTLSCWGGLSGQPDPTIKMFHVEQGHITEQHLLEQPHDR